MSIEIVAIKEVDLPNYVETIISGDESYEREAPLLAKLEVTVKSVPQIEKLYFEVREQPRGIPSIDEYYEDQVFDQVQLLISNNENDKQRTKRSNDIIGFLQMEVYKFWSGEEQVFPVPFEVSI